MCALYGSALNGGEASDWLRPCPWQQEGDNLPEGAYRSGKGYSTGVSLPGVLRRDPSSWREASHVSSQGEEAVSVTHDIYNLIITASTMTVFFVSQLHTTPIFWGQQRIPHH